MRVLAAVLIVAGLSLGGCKKSLHADLPIYPDAQGVKGKGTFDHEKVIVFNSVWVTPATLAEVTAFYDRAHPEWTRTGDPKEWVVFNDGNMKSEGELVWPLDESKPGALIEVRGAGNSTMFTVWQAKPKR